MGIVGQFELSIAEALLLPTPRANPRTQKRSWLKRRAKVLAVPLPLPTLLDESDEDRVERTKWDCPERIAWAIEAMADDPDDVELAAYCKPWLARATKPWAAL